MLLKLIFPLRPQKNTEDDILNLNFQAVEKIFGCQKTVFYENSTHLFQPRCLPGQLKSMLQVFLREFAAFDQDFTQSVIGVRGRSEDDFTCLDKNGFYRVAVTNSQSPRRFAFSQLFQNIGERSCLNIP